MRKMTFIITALCTMFLTSCQNHVDVEERFLTFAMSEYSPHDIAHHHMPTEKKVEFNVKEDIYVKQVTKDTLFTTGNTPLYTEFCGPNEKELIDDYVAILQFSMQAPEETAFAFKKMVEHMINQQEPNDEYYFMDGIQIHMTNQSVEQFADGEALKVSVHHYLPASQYYFEGVSQLEEEGIEMRLSPFIG